MRLGGPSFQKLKQPLRQLAVFAVNPAYFVRRTNFLDFIVHRTVQGGCLGTRNLRADHFSHISLGKDSTMVKVEDIQQYGKEHLETLQSGFQAIASAYGDYTKKSFEDTKSFVEKLSGVKSMDKAIEMQTEYAKSAYETFVAESQKIAGLYTDLAKQTFKPIEGMVAKFTPAAAA
jgi:phasin family protein